jgi:hypothetical protein
MLMFITSLSFAQVNEPEFLGDVYLLNDSSTIILGRENANLNTKAELGLAMLGVVSIKTKLVIPNSESPTKMKKGNVEFIIKTKDNNINPLDIIRIVKLKSTSNKRLAELSSIGTFSGVTDGKEEKINFIGKKYGQSSYRIKVNIELDGEYCFIVGGKDDFTGKSVSLSTMSVK